MMPNVLIKLTDQQALQFAADVVSNRHEWESFRVIMDEREGWWFRQWYRSDDLRGSDMVKVTQNAAGQLKTLYVCAQDQSFLFGHEDAERIELLYQEVCRQS